MIERAEQHLGPRACRYLRKFYPWYLERLGLSAAEADRFQRIDDLDEVRQRLRALAGVPVGAGA